MVISPSSIDRSMYLTVSIQLFIFLASVLLCQFVTNFTYKNQSSKFSHLNDDDQYWYKPEQKLFCIKISKITWRFRSHISIWSAVEDKNWTAQCWTSTNFDIFMSHTVKPLEKKWRVGAVNIPISQFQSPVLSEPNPPELPEPLALFFPLDESEVLLRVIVWRAMLSTPLILFSEGEFTAIELEWHSPGIVAGFGAIGLYLDMIWSVFEPCQAGSSQIQPTHHGNHLASTHKHNCMQ